MQLFNNIHSLSVLLVFRESLVLSAPLTPNATLELEQRSNKKGRPLWVFYKTDNLTATACIHYRAFLTVRDCEQCFNEVSRCPKSLTSLNPGARGCDLRAMQCTRITATITGSLTVRVYYQTCNTVLPVREVTRHACKIYR
jgi:hypothetical protein